MNKVFGFLCLSLVLFAFTGCTSMEAKLAKHVGCTENEANVTRNISVPGYQEYTVKCKNVDYSCKIAPFTEVCNPIETAKATAPVKDAEPVKKANRKK